MKQQKEKKGIYFVKPIALIGKFIAHLFPRTANGSASGKVCSDDLHYMRDLQQALLEQKTPYSLAILWLMALLLVIALLWASFARVEEITRGEGTVIPAQRGQVIQSLEGGILAGLYVHEGDMVEQGQILLKLDATRAGAYYREGRSKILGLQGTIARLRSEAYNTPLIFPAEVHKIDAIVKDETQAWQARRQSLDESIKGLQRSLQLAQNEITLSEPLMKKGLMSEVELLRMKRQANDFRLQITERKNKFRTEANAELNQLESELSQTLENVTAREDVMRRTTVMAPVRGTVNNIKVTTIGGVIPQGGEVMTITPLDDHLLIQAKIQPKDIAFLRPGLPVTVKISAYDYAIFGGMQGTLERISPDTLKEEDNVRQGSDNPTYYRVYIRTEKAALQLRDKVFPIMPGMLATIEIKTGEKTILDYILKPVLKAREAFRER